MEDARFDRIVTEGQGMLSAWLLNTVAHDGGQHIAYTAWLDSTEVVVIGYQHPEGGHTYTRPVAILVDDDLFDRLRVNESGRVDGEGRVRPPRPPGGG